MPIAVEVSNYARLSGALQDYIKVFGDATEPLTSIVNDWFQNNKQIFALKGKGKYVDLSEGYKQFKKEFFGFIYPILRASGKLERSITDKKDNDAIAVVTKKEAIMGTSTKTKDGAPYPSYLQYGTKRMPARPFIFKDERQYRRFYRIYVDVAAKKLGMSKNLRRR